MARPARSKLRNSIAAVFLLLLCLLYFRTPLLDCLTSPFGQTRNDDIPNIVHYVWTQRDPESDLQFQFKHFLSIYATRYLWHPDKIYLHTNAAPSAIGRARAGLSGKWSKEIVTLPSVYVTHVEAPTHAGNGLEITHEEHKADFIRARALHDIGGIYVDWDVYALRDISALRRTGFAAVVGRIEGRQLQVNSGTIFSRKGSKMSTLYEKRMNKVYDGKYTTHSNILLMGICERLGLEPGEVLILDQNAFTPGSWLPKHLSMFYEPERDVKSNLDGISQGERLPVYELNQENDSWDRPESLNDSWERHFYDSYMIHGFQPGVRDIPPVPGFDQLSPRYILERRSNFARALYPVVKDMYDRGVIEIDDGYAAS